DRASARRQQAATQVMPAAASTSAAATQPSEASATSSRTSDHWAVIRWTTKATQVSPMTAPTRTPAATVRRPDRRAPFAGGSSPGAGCGATAPPPGSDGDRRSAATAAHCGPRLDGPAARAGPRSGGGRAPAHQLEHPPGGGGDVGAGAEDLGHPGGPELVVVLGRDDAAADHDDVVGAGGPQLLDQLGDEREVAGRL